MKWHFTCNFIIFWVVERFPVCYTSDVLCVSIYIRMDNLVLKCNRICDIKIFIILTQIAILRFFFLNNSFKMNANVKFILKKITHGSMHYSASRIQHNFFYTESKGPGKLKSNITINKLFFIHNFVWCYKIKLLDYLHKA